MDLVVLDLNVRMLVPVCQKSGVLFYFQKHDCSVQVNCIDLFKKVILLLTFLVKLGL